MTLKETVFVNWILQSPETLGFFSSESESHQQSSIQKMLSDPPLSAVSLVSKGRSAVIHTQSYAGHS